VKGLTLFKLAIAAQVALPMETNTLVQYKTIFNFQIKIELGNRRLNKKWYPFGITISLTEKPKNCPKPTNK
jgi:hypothetical protein